MFKWLKDSIAKPPRYHFEQVYEDNKNYVYRLALSLTGNPADADDISQEVFVAVYQGLTKFKAQSHIRTWLYRITIRISGKHLQKRLPNDNQFVLDELIAPDQLAEQDQWKQLLRAMHHLSLMQRTVISLVVIEGLSHQEAAEVLGVPAGTIGSRLYNAKDSLIKLTKKKRAN